ncbi:hypothetical protein LINPERHAP1_LOCUS14397 [Linum perenne]
MDLHLSTLPRRMLLNPRKSSSLLSE